LDQVVAAMEQFLEGIVLEKMIQELIDQEAQVKQQVKVTQGLRSNISQTWVTRDES